MQILSNQSHHPLENVPSAFPLIGENIICFAKDWNEDPTSNNHIILELAKNNRVLWLNSISMRVPDFGSKRDVLKLLRKVWEFLRGPVSVGDSLYVFTPLLLPFPYSHVAKAVNKIILRLTIAFLRRSLVFQRFQLWTFNPNVVEYLGELGESLVVYYCVDEWSEFSYLDGKKMADAEERLCMRADAVFATAHSLVDKRRPFNPETHLSSHGVDYQLFATALDESLHESSELARVPRPIVGFYGMVHEWIDLDLFAYLAERHPEWSLVIIGPCRVDVSSLGRYRNIFLLGRKPYSDLPRYSKSFAVGLIPFRVNGLTRHVNPIKLREYLSAGIPVVSTDLPEVRYYSDLCAIARSYEEVDNAITQYLLEDSQEARRQRSLAMKPESWAQKAALVAAQVKRIKENRCRQ